MKRIMCVMLCALLIMVACCVAFAEGEAHEHSWGNWVTVTPASCTNAGTQRRICASCGDYEDKAIPVSQHSWGNWVTVTPASCTNAGTQRRICASCGNYEDKAIPVSQHSWGKWVTVTPAGCTTVGIQRRICASCGEHEDQKISALNHKWSNWTMVSPSSCAAEGKQRRICSLCGDFEDDVIAKKAHTEVIDAAVAASCTKTGLTEGKHCSVCNDVLLPQDEIRAIGHNYRTVTIAPTVNRRGYDRHICISCGHDYRDNYTAKLLNSEPVSTAISTPVAKDNGELGTIVYNADGIGIQYGTEWEVADAALGELNQNILFIYAAPDSDGIYRLRELHLSFELIETLKEKGIDEICFVVGDAELMLSMEALDDEMLSVVKDDLKDAVGYVLVLEPNATNAAGETGVFVKMEISTGAEGFDVSELVDGLSLYINETKSDVTHSGIYELGAI